MALYTEKLGEIKPNSIAHIDLVKPTGVYSFSKCSTGDFRLETRRSSSARPHRRVIMGKYYLTPWPQPRESQNVHFFSHRILGRIEE